MLTIISAKFHNTMQIKPLSPLQWNVLRAAELPNLPPANLVNLFKVT